MPVATYNLNPPQVRAIQIATDTTTLQAIRQFVGDASITSLAQLRALLGPDAQVGDWVVMDRGVPGFRIVSNAEFTQQYTLAT